MSTHPASSFCSLANGLLLENPDGGEVGVIEDGTPPPPRSGLAIRPNVIGEAATTFEASKQYN